jgi:DNA-directed RNA polymerase specialized sigma subunit
MNELLILATGSFKALTTEQELRYFTARKFGNEMEVREATDALVQFYQPVAIRDAFRLATSYGSTCYDTLMDLIQTATVAVWEAIKSIDLSYMKGVRPSHWVIRVMREKLERFVSEERHGMLGVPQQTLQKLKQIQAIRFKLLEKGAVNLEQIAFECGSTLEQVQEILQIEGAILSFEQELSEEGGTLGDLIAAPVKNGLREEINNVLKLLPQWDQDLIEKSFTNEDCDQDQLQSAKENFKRLWIALQA